MYSEIKLSFGYFKLKKYLVEKLNYSEKSAVKTIRDIRKTEPVVRRAILKWLTTGEKPKGDLCGINYNNLLTYRNFNPVSAFLAIDWYVKDPEAACQVLSMPQKDVEDELSDTSKDLEELILKMCGDTKEETEDTADITEF